MLLRRGPLTLRAATSLRRSLATSSTAEKEKEEDGKSSGLFSTWVNKVKGAFQSKAPLPPTDPEAPPTLIACADELKKLTRVANLANLVKLQRDANQQSYVKDLEKYSTIYRALGKHNPTGQNVNAHQKALAAEECSCSIQEVDKALEFYERMKEVASKMKQMQEKGEAIPKTMEEMSKLINNTFAEHKVPQRHSTGVAEHKVPQSYCTVAAERKVPQSHSAGVSRNSLCTCGSGKKFKRCCGRST
ncbi:hypothetical protein GOP47_0014042 [Adiantum capillus-veneris]|uniref:Uncharacterized protein n=1 Tax=Adiantum capillus-veneris TaxID=13818 RepID=A0A9D4UQD7_ADICA|nr:hypothetical protein GOP47_0014042 [Adiantum capillus-veneris]